MESIRVGEVGVERVGVRRVSNRLKQMLCYASFNYLFTAISTLDC
jgi:hypothetical protein